MPHMVLSECSANPALSIDTLITPTKEKDKRQMPVSGVESGVMWKRSLLCIFFLTVNIWLSQVISVVCML